MDAAKHGSIESENIAMHDTAAAAGAHSGLDGLAEKRLLRKVDFHVIPVLTLLFLMAFLDRSNIGRFPRTNPWTGHWLTWQPPGNAKIQGLEKDLKMKGNDYNVALFVFFIPYILFEVPSNMIIKRVAPSKYLSGIMVCWGVATMGQGLVESFGGLVAMRFLIGLFEAGFFPGCVYIISMYYKRYELQRRFTVFFSASIMAGAIGGLLAYGIAHMDGVRGYKAWRWIFIIEGLMTILVGLISYFFIVDWPQQAKFLNAEERALLMARLASDAGDANMNRLDKRAAKRIFADWKVYCGLVMYFGVVNSGYATSFFIPTILHEMGFKAVDAQARTVPIFVVATICALATAWATDRARHRYAFTILGLVVASIGYVVLLAQNGLPVGIKYFACFLIVAGTFITQPVCIAWIANCMSGHYKRSVSSAMQIGFGNAGGIVASNVFLPTEKPFYKTGFGTTLGLLGICALACTLLFFGARAENRRRDRGERDWRLQAEDADNLGDDHPHFRYAT
ncbi:Protein argonaute [Venturia nashicola]|uniref:Protein argonaute n=1 Tax=Venturia nashicola TaxID=86259 RepID=A0A4Z1P136_9PEZI|nr:Protein argonaute [Venturia nashicola]TLD19383.1 Protein argonaute [Venturia nashicola]